MAINNMFDIASSPERLSTNDFEISAAKISQQFQEEKLQNELVSHQGYDICVLEILLNNFNITLNLQKEFKQKSSIVNLQKEKKNKEIKDVLIYDSKVLGFMVH